jgi:kindlin 2
LSGPESILANSPTIPTQQAFELLYRPSNLQEKARINAGWYDSSRSLMEQGVTEHSLVLLKFKFFAFYDLNPKYDAIRINQLYEQAKWSILSQELNCSIDEMLLFAALQLQVQIQSQLPQHSPDGATTHNGRTLNESDEDHIDAALNELQRALEGCVTTSSEPVDIGNSLT